MFGEDEDVVYKDGRPVVPTSPHPNAESVRHRSINVNPAQNADDVRVNWSPGVPSEEIQAKAVDQLMDRTEAAQVRRYPRKWADVKAEKHRLDGWIMNDDAVLAIKAEVLDLLKPEPTGSGYPEGWNDSLYVLLDLLDRRLNDGRDG